MLRVGSQRPRGRTPEGWRGRRRDGASVVDWTARCQLWNRSTAPCNARVRSARRSEGSDTTGFFIGSTSWTPLSTKRPRTIVEPFPDLQKLTPRPPIGVQESAKLRTLTKEFEGNLHGPSSCTGHGGGVAVHLFADRFVM